MTFYTDPIANISGLMRKWEPVRIGKAKNYNNNEAWKIFEEDGLKTKLYSKKGLISVTKNKNNVEDSALMIDDIIDPYNDLKRKLNINV